MEQTKKCLGCGHEKPLAEFRKQAKQPQGVQPRCRVCMKPVLQAWYQKNRDKIRARTRQWQQDHPEQYHASLKEWRVKNRERKLEYDRQYNAEHREQQKEYSKQPEVRVRARQHAKNQKAKRKIAKGATHHPITAAEWLQIKAAYSYICAYCNTRETPEALLTQDHVVPLKKGGSHTAENIVPACGPCNTMKQTMSLVEFLLYARRKREM